MGLILLTVIGNAVIALGWTVTKMRMGVEWMIVAYQVGRDTARGVENDGRS